VGVPPPEAEGLGSEIAPVVDAVAVPRVGACVTEEDKEGDAEGRGEVDALELAPSLRE
jgi:hypothetical protein